MKIKKGFGDRFLLIAVLLITACSAKPEIFTNSEGMKFIKIEEGSFKMGEVHNLNSEKLGAPLYLKQGDWDEHPVHKVTISYPFYISAKELTIKQFQKFRPDYKGNKEYAPYASGISWDDAMAYCRWLSEKEDKIYRLPTEAEWAYAANSENNSVNSSNVSLPSSREPNDGGIKNMNTGVAEWCLDWHGKYPATDKINPVGPEHGWARVVRGGGLDQHDPYYFRTANRAGMPPNFPPIALEKIDSMKAQDVSVESLQKDRENELYKDFSRTVLNNEGNHNIGFRIVQAPMPKTEYSRVAKPFFQQGVMQDTTRAKTGPDMNKPYFRKRYLLPTPPENIPVNQIRTNKITGLHPAILRHHHSPAFVALPNGDLLAIYYTAAGETSADVALIASRLRFGHEQWDMPSLFLDLPDVNDHAPMLWNDSDKIWFFWGANQLDSGFPFQWITSTDNGASWSEIQFPIFPEKVGGYSAQPITSAFRMEDKIFVSSDGIGAESLVWISDNGGKTWEDPGGRTGGRHTAFVPLKDERILGMGGKNSNIEGYMPKYISDDGGHTWKAEKTPFPSLGSNQRPTVLRLQSGRLFFAGDLQRRDGYQPADIAEKFGRGAYVALSDDEGETWHIKKLPGAQLHEAEDHRKDLKGATLGYAVARQAPNGMIHLITSMNRPNLHFALNEAWILQPGNELLNADSDELTSPKTRSVSRVKEYSEDYPDGSLKLRWSAGMANNGRYLLNGKETWYYKNGRKKYEATYKMGNKTGNEKYWSEDGNLIWSWQHKENDLDVWTHWWPNGNKKSESYWRNFKAEGMSTSWDREGKVVGQVEYEHGMPLRVETKMN